MAQKIIKSDCILCINSCGIDAYVKDGKLVKVEGMKEHPISEGALCPRGEALPEWVYSKGRLQHPMQKVDGKWERISWDDALDTIAEKLQEIKDKYGARGLAVYTGSLGTENIELAAYAQRFRGVYGTPNLLSVEGNCFRSRIMARQMTFGGYPIEEPWNSKCVIVYGQNMDNSRITVGSKIYKAMDDGTLEHLIIIDPKRIPMAEKGIHLQLRPGTDTALTLGFLNVIIGEDLYDKEFVEKSCMGFNRLKEHVKQYTPETIEEITWVPADDIRKVARLFAQNTPASLVPGTCSIDQHINGFQGNRIHAIMQAVTGNINIPGGWVSIPFIRLGDMRVTEISDPIGTKEHPLFRRFWGRTSPYGQQMLFADAVLKEEPYPIKGLICTGGNPALTLPDSERIKEAMRALDFMVVSELFMTETAELADIVLPACSFLEKSGVGYVYGVTNCIPYAMLRKKVIEPIGESRPDWKIWTGIANRMGYQEHFPWKTEEEVIDFFLKPSGLTREQLDTEHPEGMYYAEKQYKPGKFYTPSGKIELYSETLAENGYDPIPKHVEPSKSPVSTPELFKKYPVILSTGARVPEYTHSQFRGVPSLKKMAPEPLAEIHPDTAGKYGISDGDMMTIETTKGQIEIKALTTEALHPGIVSIPHGWAKANSNVLTELEPRDPVTGYTEMKALLCRVAKA
ncbi:MAG: molybdopterin-dependent oxidoreductase [Deltaproteobacteria bacterium]|nr:molybdopterin-dependent oxidoreductase [Deltaproteobacteria bacterium]